MIRDDAFLQKSSKVDVWLDSNYVSELTKSSPEEQRIYIHLSYLWKLFAKFVFVITNKGNSCYRSEEPLLLQIGAEFLQVGEKLLQIGAIVTSWFKAVTTYLRNGIFIARETEIYKETYAIIQIFPNVRKSYMLKKEEKEEKLSK